jgi:hypothetical protein
MFWLAREFKQPLFAGYERRVAAPSALDLLWFDPAEASPKAAGLPLDKYFRGAEVAVLRSDWEDPKALFVGFKAGDNKVNHSHLDLGSFVFDAGGARWAMDLGADNYNLPGYFGGQRWNYYRLRAEGHNTLVINPGAGPDQDPSAAAPIERFTSQPDTVAAVADLTAAYASDAQSVKREITLRERRTVRVRDRVRLARPVEVWWFFHTRAEAKLAPDGRAAHLTQDGKELRVSVVEPASASLTVMEAQPLPGSPKPEKQNRNAGVRKLAIRLANVSDLSLEVVFEPGPWIGEDARGGK